MKSSGKAAVFEAPVKGKRHPAPADSSRCRVGGKRTLSVAGGKKIDGGAESEMGNGEGGEEAGSIFAGRIVDGKLLAEPLDGRLEGKSKHPNQVMVLAADTRPSRTHAVACARAAAGRPIPAHASHPDQVPALPHSQCETGSDPRSRQ